MENGGKQKFLFSSLKHQTPHQAHVLHRSDVGLASYLLPWEWLYERGWRTSSHRATIRSNNPLQRPEALQEQQIQNALNKQRFHQDIDINKWTHIGLCSPVPPLDRDAEKITWELRNLQSFGNGEFPWATSFVGFGEFERLHCLQPHSQK